jgi:hypothetical protein
MWDVVSGVVEELLRNWIFFKKFFPATIQPMTTGILQLQSTNNNSIVAWSENEIIIFRYAFAID